MTIRNYTIDNFKTLVNKQNWELIDEFTSGITKKYNFKCKNCGNIHLFWGCYMVKNTVNPICLNCHDKKEEYNKKLEDMGSTIRIYSINKITTANNPTKVECLACGLHYETKPRIPLNGHGCPNCYILKQRNVNIILNKSNINYKEFKDACRKIQRYNIINYKLFDMGDIGKYEYHIDHKYSLRDCFDNNINISIASSPINLQKMWWRDNIKKHKVSCITLEELTTNHVKWMDDHGGEEKYLNNLKLGNMRFNKDLLNSI